MNIPCPLYDLVKEMELLKSSHPALPWKSESCGPVPGAAISCAGGWMMWARWWHWHRGVRCRPEERGVLCCFGKWWQVSCCHYSVVTSLVMLSCWAGCILGMQVLVQKSFCCWRVLEKQFDSWCVGSVESNKSNGELNFCLSGPSYCWYFPLVSRVCCYLQDQIRSENSR